MIKVLFIVASSKIHGSEKIALEIAKGLDSSRFDVYFAIPEDGDITALLKKYDIKKIVYDNGRLNTISFTGSKNLFKAIRKHKFDIIHSHSSSIPGLLAKIAGVKLKIETRHGLFYSDEQLENLSKKRYLFEYIKQFYFDVITTVSENDKQRLIKYFKYDGNKIITIYNGLDKNLLSKYSKKDFLKKSSRGIFLLGNVGRFTYQKNQELLINIFSKLIKFFPDIKLQIIGEGELKDGLIKQIANLNLGNFVELIPYKKNIYDYISKFDLMVMTSRYEGIPLVILEAMALGIPVISSDVGGVNEVIMDKDTGILVNSLDENEFTDKILKLIHNPEDLKLISSNSSKFIQNFSVENMVRNYENMYLKYLNR